jgi:aspartyl/asparaginyl beta-hydroxylase (cupin superfamily)
MPQVVDDATLAQIREVSAGFQRSFGPGRLKAFVALGQLSSLLHRGGRWLSRDRHPPTEDPDRRLQVPWLPRWPHLAAKPFHAPAEFPWTKRLEDSYEVVRAELMTLSAERGRFQKALYAFDNHSWGTYYFYLNGKRFDENCARCPETAKLVDAIPDNNKGHICFSALNPGNGLPPHVGPSNISLICHLGLLNCEGTVLYSGTQERKYEEGKCLILDDSFVHSVVHGGTKTRVTLMITFWHPGITTLERRALRVIMGHLLD